MVQHWEKQSMQLLFNTGGKSQCFSPPPSAPFPTNKSLGPLTS